MKKILFQGDSITDAGREREWIYSWDGVHPTPKGHEVIKRAWMKAFEEMMK